MSLADLSLHHILTQVDQLLLNTPSLTNTSLTPSQHNHTLNTPTTTTSTTDYNQLQPTTSTPKPTRSLKPITTATMQAINQLPSLDNQPLSPKTNTQPANTSTSTSSKAIPTEQQQPPSNQEKTIKPTTEENSEEIRIHKYMAIHLIDQIKNTPTTFFNPFSAESPQSQTQATSSEPIQNNDNHHPSILASPHPHRSTTENKEKQPKSNVGLRINSSFPPQELAISTGQANPEILYTAEPAPHVLPITLFPSSMVFSPGNRVAVDGFISYATKAGRIRVIDQNSGARMLLRKHEGPVLDMCIGRPRAVVGDLNSNTTSSRRWRCIASAGSDGRLVIWKVPVRFDEDTANYEILADILSVNSDLLLGPEKELLQAPSHLRFSTIRWHPHDPSIFLLSTNDHRLILVRLDRGAFAASWKRGTPLGKSLSELEAFEGQDVLRTNSDVVAFAFSPDGSAFAFVTEDKMLTVRQTSKPHWTIMGGQLPSSHGSITRLEFLATSAGVIKGFLITKRFGTRVEAVQLSEISEVVIGITLHPPEPVDDLPLLPCFGHSAWQAQYSTVLLSNSLRGSIFAFHLNFCENSSADDELLLLKPGHSEGPRLGAGTQPSDDDASYIERVAATRQSSQMQRSRSNSWIASRTMFVDQISEVPSPDPIISFVLDQGMRPPPGPSSSPVSVFNLHPKGIHQLYLPKDLIDFQTQSDQQPNPSQLAVPPTRSRSLAGEILVDVHVEHQVQKAEVLDFSDDDPKSKPLPPSVTANPVDSSNLDSKKPIPPSTSSKQDLKPRRSTHHQSTSSASLHPSLSVPPPSSSSNSAPVDQKAPPSFDGSLFYKELEKNRTSVIEQVHHLLGKSLDKQEQKLRNQFLAQQEIETRRHEHLLNILSTSLSSKNLGQIVKEQVKATLAVNDNHRDRDRNPNQNREPSDSDLKIIDGVRLAVQEGLKKHLGKEIEGVMKKTSIQEMIRESVKEGMDKMIEESKLERMISKTIAETASADQGLTQLLVEEIRDLNTQVRVLKDQVVEKDQLNQLRIELIQLQELVKNLQHPGLRLSETSQLASSVHQPHPPPLPPPLPPPPHHHHHSHQAYQSDNKLQQQQQEEEDVKPSLLPHHLQTPLPLPHPPPPFKDPTPSFSERNGERARRFSTHTDYEQVFLEALGDRSSDLLDQLIDNHHQTSAGEGGGEGEEDRLAIIFPSNQHRSLLSQPVLLTLAHQLSQDLAVPNSFDNLLRLNSHDDHHHHHHHQNPHHHPQHHPELVVDRFHPSLGHEGLNKLRWIWSCINAIDEHDQQTAQYFDRVLDLCYLHLASRKSKLGLSPQLLNLHPANPLAHLQGNQEIDGINQVLWIIQDKLQKFKNLVG
ncbi:hypothetical protein PGT21_020890 [Puccinia graminis f. sp. tritici]|uniref:Enhancer of mRNA-decapping protein 4 WD40 repeat region domain-containing protein n=1 Tax=Puccinia graminis f. sp. tritici TaxID=56615 RepID=A0A5B0PAL3_PUCGR|nr:hypothetical protein PGT21_020890 [Puccinia graminis f. sp. tritici]